MLLGPGIVMNLLQTTTLGALAALWICLIVCVPITLCCVVGCVVYHCFIKDK